MIVLKILGCIFLFLFLIALIPVRIRVSYDQEVRVYVPILFLRIKLYPRKPKLKNMSKRKYDKLTAKKKKKKEKDKNKKPDEKHKFSDKTEKTKKISLSELPSLISEVSRVVGEILSKLSKYLKVRIYAFKIVVSGEDAAKTAVTYGVVSGTVGTLMSVMEDRCRISYPKKSETGVCCDFISGKSTAKIDIRFSIFVWQIVVLGIKSFISFLKIKTKLEVNNHAGNKNK